MDATTHFSTRDAARILHATEPRVRTWARMGGIAPEAGAGGRLEFTFQQLLILRTIRGLLEAGVPASRVRRMWSTLQRQLSDDLPLTSIRILAEGKRAIAWDGKAPWQPDSGQFVLDFERLGVAEEAAAPERADGAERAEAAKEREAPTLSLAPALAPILAMFATPESPAESQPREARSRHRNLDEDADESDDLSEETSETSAEQWFRLGSELEVSSPLEARHAYLQAIAVDPMHGDAHLNLGRLDHRAGELGAAEARYRRAIECDPEDATAHFNLGVLLEDRRCPQGAAEAYERAIACDPELADAHYNLGLLLERLGRRADALRHLMTAHHLYSS